MRKFTSLDPSWTAIFILLCWAATIESVRFDKSQLNFVREFLYNGSQATEKSDCSAFPGVTCDHVGMITKLDLSGTNISGEIPTTVGNLHRLTYLDISNTGISGVLPSEIIFLSKLAFLFLSSCRISGPLPSSIGKLTALQKLEAQNTQINGPIPSSIAKLIALKSLNLAHTSVQGPIPDIFKNLSINFLSIGSTLIDGSIPPSLFMMKSLEYLALDNTALSGSLPSSLGNLASLTYLDLSRTNLDGSLPSNLGNLQNVTLIYLGKTQISGAIPSSIGKLTALKYLWIGETQISGPIPKSIGKLTALEFLNLAITKIYGSIPKSIGALTNLNALLLSNTNINGSLPVEIGNMKSLVTLNLQTTSISGPIPTSVGNLTLLQDWTSSESQLTGTIPKSIVQLKNLQNLAFTSTLLEGPIPSQIGDLTKLTFLSFSTTQISGCIPASIGNLVKLTTLQLGNTNLGCTIPKSIGKLTNLQLLQLSDNQITGHIPDSIGNLVSLSELGLYRTKLQGSLPRSIGNMTSLSVLTIFLNNISGPIPDTIGNLKGLLVLDMHGCNFSGPIPESFGGLQSLGAAFLYNNSLKGSIPSSIGNLKNLQVLYLFGNRLSGNIPETLVNLEKLQYVDWDHNSFSGPIPSLFGTMPQLVELNLGYNKLSGSIPESFSNLVNLQALDLSGNELTGYVPNSVATLPSLVILFLNDNYFTGPQPSVPFDQPNFSLNCWSNVNESTWKPGCAFFCDTLKPHGACFGNGRCFINPKQHDAPTCTCDPGYVLDPKDKFKCVFLLKHKVGFVPSNSSLSLSSHFNKFSRQRSFGFDSTRAKWLIGNSADWRLGTSGVRNQGNCNSCWSISSIAAFETLSLIFGQSGAFTMPLFSEKEVTQCNAFSSLASCALGGWPEAAFDFIASRNGQLSREGKFKGCSKKEVPSAVSSSYGSVMFESVDFFGWFGIIIALQQQPLVAFVHGSFPTFQLYQQGVYSDPDCFPSGTVDHTVVLEGYELKSLTPYWIVRNSWGMGWGEQGDMRMAIAGGDGVCGLHSVPAMYPVISGLHPCDNPINPCGGGQCIAVQILKAGNASGGSKKGVQIKNWCRCPGDNFVNVTSVDGTQTCSIKYVCSSMLFNPCSSGTCVDDLKGSYSCICPSGFRTGKRTDGSNGCIPRSGAPPKKLQYKIQPRVTCSLLSLYGLTPKELESRNPKIQCNKSLPLNAVVDVTPPPSYKCSLHYSWNQGDNCSTVSNLFGLSVSSLKALNPASELGCTAGKPGPVLGQQICVSSKERNVPRPFCSQLYSVQEGETCGAVQNSFNLSATEFIALNQGIYCRNLSPPRRARTSFSSSSLKVCVAGFPTSRVCKNKSKLYTVQVRDNCLSIQHYLFGGDSSAFANMNGGVQCSNDKLFVGMQVCVAQ